MIMTSVEAIEKIRALISTYEDNIECLPHTRHLVDVAFDKRDVIALKIAIKALGSLEPFSFIDLDGGDPDAH